jgi:hypothetical protein
MLKSGLPAHEAIDGFPVTFRRPHDLTAADLDVFTRAESFPPFENSLRPRPFEAVIVLSLPKKLLHPIPGVETDPCLRRLPSSLLAALRPPSFAAAVDAKPWEKGALLLPTEAVLRVYQLTSTECLASGPGLKGKLRNGKINAAHSLSINEGVLAANRSVIESNPGGNEVFGRGTIMFKEMSWNPASEDLEGGYPDLPGATVVAGKGLLRFRAAVRKVIFGNRLNVKIQRGIATRAERQAVWRRRAPTLGQRLLKVFLQGETAMHGVQNRLFTGEGRHLGLEEPENVVQFAKKMMQVRWNNQSP